MIALTWIGITDQFQTAALHDFVVMPDHIHGLLTLDRSDLDDGNDRATLGEVIGWFKGKTTFLYGQGVQDRGWPRYSGKLWQPRFHDHIIRDDRDFNARVLYIERNPWRWVENRT
jgi:REP element-mobilizing transposase RayT